MKTNKYLTIAALLLTSSWSAFATNNDKIPGATVQDAAFFTGKPFDSDLESYVFNYRNYNAEAGRWTTADPSGFPEGANNAAYVKNQVTSYYDVRGLTGKSVLWVYAHEPGTDNVNGEGADASFAQNMSDIRGETMQQMDTWDIQSSGPVYPHYIDDGDFLTQTSIWSLSELSSFTGYSYIMLLIHGMPGAHVWGINGTRYSSAQVAAAFPRGVKKWFDGCGNYVGGLSESDFYAKIQEKTYNYLFE